MEQFSIFELTAKATTPPMTLISVASDWNVALEPILTFFTVAPLMVPNRPPVAPEGASAAMVTLVFIQDL